MFWSRFTAGIVFLVGIALVLAGLTGFRTFEVNATAIAASVRIAAGLGLLSVSAPLVATAYEWNGRRWREVAIATLFIAALTLITLARQIQR